MLISESGKIMVKSAGEQAESLVADAFKKAGWDTLTSPAGQFERADAVVNKANHRYLLEIKAIPRGSSVSLEDYWSRAVLQVRHFAEVSGNTMIPLAIVVAPKVSEAASRRLVAFREKYAPDVAMGVMDYYGRRVFRGAGLESLNADPIDQTTSVQRQSAPKANLFSGLNQWLLKVLLAPDLPERMLGAPRDVYRNASELASAAKCSTMSAHRFVEQLRTDGFLHENSRHLSLVRRAELMRQWQIASARPTHEISMRTIRKRDIHDLLPMYFPDRRACLGLFAAADELGFGLVSGVPPHVLVDRVSILPGEVDAMPMSRELRTTNDGEPADLIVRVPKAVKSVFRAAIRPNQVQCADIIQVWLDVSNHGSRGEEQAELIWRKCLREPLGITNEFA